MTSQEYKRASEVVRELKEIASELKCAESGNGGFGNPYGWSDCLEQLREPYRMAAMKILIKKKQELEDEFAAL